MRTAIFTIDRAGVPVRDALSAAIEAHLKAGEIVQVADSNRPAGVATAGNSASLPIWMPWSRTPKQPRRNLMARRMLIRNFVDALRSDEPYYAAARLPADGGGTTLMPFYLVEGVYTREALKTLVGNPQSRLKPVTDMLAKVSGKLHYQFFVLGECDMIALFEVPDDVDAAAVSLIVSTSGHMASFKTRRLLTDEEGVRAMRKAHGITVSQPS